MCGISGILNFSNSSLDLNQIKAMTDAIAHRGPDGEGHWINPNQSVALGHRRLAIIDLSEDGKQPMHYLNRYTITFNGEIYNYLELKLELEQAGYSFKSASDTEVLLALFDQKKEKCLDFLDGMFAFAIWDEKEQKLFCARDRFGEKPFYFSYHDSMLYFGSEIKVFWAVNLTKKPNKQRIFDYLAFDRIEGINTPTTTFFENIHQLAPAHYFVLEKSSLYADPIQKKYWDIDLSKKATLSFEQAQFRFKELFIESISRRLRSDVPVGSSLSGGLDSSSIVCLINEIKKEDITQHTFSARFPNFKKDEGEFIDQINTKVNSSVHQVECTTDSLMPIIQTLFKFQDEPFGSSSIAAQYEVMKLAKQENITVLLDGQGADEYLAGYTSFYLNYLAELRKKDKKAFNQFLIDYKAHFGQELHPGRTFFIDASYPKLRDFIRRIRNIGVKPSYLKQFNAEFLGKVKTAKYSSGFKNNLNESLYAATTQTSLQTLLRYADRNSMANSREVRLPFLSHELVEFVFSLPADFKIHELWTKAILRYSLADILPKEICWRKEKVGFEPPNYKAVDEKELENALQILTQNKIIDPSQILDSKKWEYVQIAHLYD